MLLELFGMNYILHLTASEKSPVMDLRVVDEAFCRAPLAAEIEEVPEILSLFESYTGIILDELHKLKVVKYFDIVKKSRIK